jgi:uncharacterized protein (DUF58 family)
MTPVRLTGRGRGVAAGGIALVLAGLWFELTAVLAGGIFALMLTAATVGAALLLRRGSVAARSDQPAAASVGDVVTAAAELRLPRAAPAAVVGGLVPSWGSAPQRQPLVLLPPWRGPRTAARGFTCPVRGRYDWPAVTLHVPEPLGMAYAVVAEREAGAAFAVYPRVLPLAGVPLDQAGDGEGAPAAGRSRRSGAAGSASDPVPRAYQPGDELRRMHWPATARAGEPMVRTDEHEPVLRTVVALDCRTEAYRTDAGFERAVTAAASVAVALLQAGRSVSLQTPSGGLLTGTRWQEGRQGAAAVLAALAGVTMGEQGASSGHGADASPGWVITGSGTAVAQSAPTGAPLRLLTTETPDAQGPSGAAAAVVWDGSSSLAASVRQSIPLPSGSS